MHVTIFWKQTIKPSIRSLCLLKEGSGLAAVGGFCLYQQGGDDWAGRRVRDPNTLMVWAWWMVLPQVRRFCCRTELSGVLDPDSPQTARERHCTKELQKEGGCRWTRVCCLVAELIPLKAPSGTHFPGLKVPPETWVPAEVAECGISCSITTDHPASLSGQSGQAYKRAIGPVTAYAKIHRQIFIEYEDL